MYVLLVSSAVYHRKQIMRKPSVSRSNAPVPDTLCERKLQGRQNHGLASTCSVVSEVPFDYRAKAIPGSARRVDSKLRFRSRKWCEKKPNSPKYMFPVIAYVCYIEDLSKRFPPLS
jgi:hypothetical protein